MIVVMGIMLVTSLLLAAAFTASEGEVHLASTDTNQKKAYYAAQAGINEYLYHLTQDSNYLSYCTKPNPENPALNEVVEHPSELHWATLPGSAGEPTTEKYAIELLPAEDAPVTDKKCDPNNLVETMIEQKGPATGTFRIKSIGVAGNSERTIVATFKNLNFVNFVWFTKYETFDPVIYGLPYKAVCENFYAKRPAGCKNNYFVTGETIEGPVHTEDHVGVCGEPVFGRSASDKIEFHAIGSSDEGYSAENECGAAANPKFVGTHVPPKQVQTLEPPPGDEELQHIVEKEEYEFKNKTEIVLEGHEMTVTTSKGTNKVPFPKNHLIYVAGEGSCQGYSPYGPVPSYTADAGCGNVYVRGEYTESLTIAAQNDVVIDGSITGPGTGGILLGLIANNFIRIYHPLSGARGLKPNECLTAKNNMATDLKEPTVDAAMLALKHALMVDNYDCGEANLGNLNVFGALAGYFSNGLTGVFSGTTIIHGYPYNLKYDRRLLAEEPPHFLNPIRAAWQVERETLAKQ